jgi:hypothetical protein
MASLPRLSSLAFFCFEINSAIEGGNLKPLSFKELYDHIDDSSLFDWLESNNPGLFDFSMFPAGSPERDAVSLVLADAASGLRGRERKKVGIEHSGLHLLIAFLIEAIQHKQWI